MKNFDELLAYFNDKLGNECFEGEPKLLYAPVEYTMSLGGKRVRPVMMLMAADMFGGDIESVVNSAIGLELFHNFTLLHDDLMDRSPIRRGKPTVYRKWNENIAVLSGDVMFAMAYSYFLKSGSDSLPDVLSFFTTMAIEICEGQQMDMDFESRTDVSMDEYIEMIRLKTSVMLGTALKIGAVIAGVKDKDLDYLYDFGINVGLAFQLTDDYLDTFGDEKSFGKKPGNDIVTGKKTFLYLKSFQNAGLDEISELKSAFDNLELEQNRKLEIVKNLYIKLGVDRDCMSEINKYYEKAMAALDKVNLVSERKVSLADLAGQLMIRNH